MARTLGQLQVIRWVISLNTEFGSVGSDAVVSTNWIQVRIASTQRNSTGEPDRLELRRRSRPRIRTDRTCALSMSLF